MKEKVIIPLTYYLPRFWLVVQLDWLSVVAVAVAAAVVAAVAAAVVAVAAEAIVGLQLYVGTEKTKCNDRKTDTAF